MKPNFTDARGTITDLFVNDDLSVTDITFTEGAIRGNHYHEHTKQIDIVMEGELEARKVDLVEGEQYATLKEGEQVTHWPHEAHAYKATKPSRIISICFGVRKGTDYEKDVIRLKEPLL